MSEFEYDKLSLDGKRAVQGIRGVEDNIRTLQKDFELAVFDLERKWSSKFKEAYERRFTILSGTSAPTGDEIAAGERKSKRNDPDYKALPTLKDEAKPAPIENFWLHVLTSSNIEAYIVASDIPALKHLTNITLSYPSKAKVAAPAFAIDCYFSENVYFKNSKLKLTYYYKEEVNATGQLQPSHITADKINWKPKGNLVQEAAKGSDDDDDGEESFFAIFQPQASITTPPPAGSANKNDDVERTMALESAFDFGLELKKLVLPNAGDYLLGEMEEEDDDDDDDDDWDEHIIGDGKDESDSD